LQFTSGKSMKTSLSIRSQFLAVSSMAFALSLMASSAVQAQQVYRIVGPDGKVTFSDKPPAADTKSSVTSGTGANAGTGGSALPFELKQVASKFPVTLYTSADCAPCGSARALLQSRGVPFLEKTIKTPEDSQALSRISGDNGLPFATIGGQQLKGYSDAEYTQYLNAAGYPSTSILPPSYRPPAATPLVAVVAAPAPAPAAAARPAPTPAPAPAPAEPPNPAGIRF
jgi:glutaredoxin